MKHVGSPGWAERNSSTRICSALLAATAAAAVQAQDSSLDRTTYSGTLGLTRIGLTLFVQGGNSITTGHYFYAKYLSDIPLTGTVQAGGLTLKDSDALQFVGNGSSGGQRRDFTNSVGLDGTWSKTERACR
jgi:hypothetical protein